MILFRFVIISFWKLIYHPEHLFFLHMFTVVYLFIVIRCFVMYKWRWSRKRMEKNVFFISFVGFLHLISVLGNGLSRNYYIFCMLFIYRFFFIQSFMLMNLSPATYATFRRFVTHLIKTVILLWFLNWFWMILFVVKYENVLFGQFGDAIGSDWSW